MLKVAGVAAIVLALVHAAFVFARPDLRTQLALTVVSLVLLVIGGILALRASRSSLVAIVAALVTVVVMGLTGGEIDPFYLALMMVILALASVGFWRQHR